MLRAVQLRKHLAQHHANRRLRHGEFASVYLFESGRSVSIGQTLLGVDDPYVFNSKLTILRGFRSHSCQGVLWRKNLDGDQRRVSYVALERVACACDENVGNAKTLRFSLSAKFRENLNSPFGALHPKKGR